MGHVLQPASGFPSESGRFAGIMATANPDHNVVWCPVTGTDHVFSQPAFFNSSGNYQRGNAFVPSDNETKGGFRAHYFTVDGDTTVQSNWSHHITAWDETLTESVILSTMTGDQFPVQPKPGSGSTIISVSIGMTRMGSEIVVLMRQTNSGVVSPTDFDLEQALVFYDADTGVYIRHVIVNLFGDLTVYDLAWDGTNIIAVGDFVDAPFPATTAPIFLHIDPDTGDVVYQNDLSWISTDSTFNGVEYLDTSTVYAQRSGPEIYLTVTETGPVYKCYRCDHFGNNPTEIAGTSLTDTSSNLARTLTYCYPLIGEIGSTGSFKDLRVRTGGNEATSQQTSTPRVYAGGNTYA